MSVIGIDMGFQTSTVSCPRGGGIDTLLNEYSQRQTSYVEPKFGLCDFASRQPQEMRSGVACLCSRASQREQMACSCACPLAPTPCNLSMRWRRVSTQVQLPFLEC
jgi:hypothetical protein